MARDGRYGDTGAIVLKNASGCSLEENFIYSLQDMFDVKKLGHWLGKVKFLDMNLVTGDLFLLLMIIINNAAYTILHFWQPNIYTGNSIIFI